MFEKEAEEYVNEEYDFCYYPEDNLSTRINAERDWSKGAEFGYNKANEWHYVKDGEHPERGMQVLVLLENKRMKISIFMENDFVIWNRDYDTYTKLYNVIAWKEIILPKLPKEIKE